MSAVTSGSGARGRRITPSDWVVRLDRSFRLFGKLALALLLATAGLIAADVEAWRGVFALAHLAALVALLPLGIALVAHAFRAASADGEGGLMSVVRRHRLVAALLAVTVVTVALSLANFEDGSRFIRRTANFTTVGIVVVLVWRYLAWSRDALPRR
jgi:uncharacterized membrane protein YidH (DUF202 family)